jgi:Gas vesicle synthesis protein GvpL/GvpF
MAAGVKPGAEVWYLYGISEARTFPAVGDVGVASSAVLPVECDGLTCWISKVSAEEFDHRLADNMQNLDWIAKTSVAHQRAVSAIAAGTDLLPARLATVFCSRESLTGHIRKHAVGFRRDLDRVKDAREWGIKVFAVESSPGLPKKIRSGKDYLKAKAALLPKPQKGLRASSQAGELARELESVAIESAAPGKVSSGQKGLAFQTTILVKRKDEKKLQSILAELSRRWNGTWKIECSGPWPPYSFVSRLEPEA